MDKCLKQNSFCHKMFLMLFNCLFRINLAKTRIDLQGEKIDI